MDERETFTGGGAGTTFAAVCARCERLKKALRFYAKGSNYDETTDYRCFSHEEMGTGRTYVDEDEGYIAQQALKGDNEPK